jgi:hypothetical protein
MWDPGGGVAKPALRKRKSIEAGAEVLTQNSTLSNEERFRVVVETLPARVVNAKSFLTSLAAELHLASERHAMTTSAPSKYIVVAVANPTPEFAPVTTTVLPAMLKEEERSGPLEKAGRK